MIVQRIDPKSPAEVNWAIRSVKSGIMATLRGWAPCGMRLPAKVPHGHWKTTTFLAALRTIVAPWVLDGPVDGESFQIYVEKVLLPTPKQGDIVIMDNLGSHRGKPCGPKYSPDLNPIGAGLCQAQASAAQSLRPICRRSLGCNRSVALSLHANAMRQHFESAGYASP